MEEHVAVRSGRSPGRARRWLAIAMVAGTTAAVAAPASRRPAPRKPVPAQDSAASKEASAEAELKRLNDEYNALSGRKAYFAAVKVARRAFELQVEATGPTSDMALYRMRTLVSALAQVGDVRGELALE